MGLTRKVLEEFCFARAVGTLLTVTEVIPTSDVAEAFKDLDVAILVGAMPRREGMERKDLLKANVRIFKQQGEALSQHAKKTCKVALSY